MAKCQPESKLKSYCILIFVLLTGIFLGAFSENRWAEANTEHLIKNITPIRENNFNYQFIYPLLRYDFGQARRYLEDKVLEVKIKEYIDKQYTLGNADSISVYFTDLLNGHWSGVNENVQYHPGSMTKVLIMMTYYRESQLDTSIMHQTFNYSKDVDTQIHKFLPLATPTNLKIGKDYTIKYLIEDMIINSDDGAEVLLYANMNKGILNDIYKDLKIQSLSVPDYTISDREYSIFLRILYNSTYLTEANSEDALSIMSRSTFHDGLYSGLPVGVLVAHKYGENGDVDKNTHQLISSELHDCGIVYATSYPYEICVMTKSNKVVDRSQLAKIISDISALVYKYVNAEK